LATIAVENYVKRLFIQQQREPGQRVAMGKLARAMEVAPGTATAMVKGLCESGLVDYEPRGGALLTPAGEAIALHVLRRHRLVELFLVNVLHLDWSEVHEEAERLEHAISDKLLERLDEMLGRPAVDPHGDPIPTARGKVHKHQSRSLAAGGEGRVRVVRVMDQDPRFLQMVDRMGLMPGSTAVVESLNAAADAVTIRPDDREAVTLGMSAAEKIQVEAV